MRVTGAAPFRRHEAGHLTAATAVARRWDPDLHPRGRDGRFIEAGGIVKVFDAAWADPKVGKVDAIERGGVIRVSLNEGSTIRVNANQIEQVNVVARLHPDAAKSDAPVVLPTSDSSGVSTGTRPATADDRKRLKIPPAWTDVVVSEDPNAALQAKGRDAKGRAQYRYSEDHHARQADKKFARMRELHKVLPKLDVALERDAPNDGTAAAVYLIRKMGVRNGSETDTGADTFAYGASNLRARHVLVDGDNVTLDFDAKDNVHLTLPVEDDTLKQLLRDRVRGLNPDDSVFGTNETKTNFYLKQHTGEDFKIKDLRTYLANARALTIIASIPKPKTFAEYKKARLEVAKAVAAILGNTPAIALSSYINPSVFYTWTENASWSTD